MGTLRSWVEDGVLCGVGVGLAVAIPLGSAEHPGLALLMLVASLVGGAGMGAALRASLQRSARGSLLWAVPLGVLVSAWANAGLAQVWVCGLGCPDSGWYTPVGHVLGTLVGLTWLAYAPVRHRGREGTWILFGALTAGAALLVPLYIVCFESHLH